MHPLRRSRRRPSRLATLLVTAALPASAVLAGPAGAATAAEVNLTGKGPKGTPVTGVAQIAVTGGTEVDVDVSTVSGGEAVVARGPGEGLSRSVRFPRYVDSGSYPRAVLEVEPESGGAFDPGADDFSFGAVLKLAPRSDGRAEDDGDNVFQRGLYADAAQFKLQIDGGRPSCLVKGNAGRVKVTGPKIDRGTWYTISCARKGSALVVKTARYDGTGGTDRHIATGSTGKLSFSSSTPASVGGKLDGSGKVVAGSSDQFNGRVAEVWLRDA